MDEFGLIESFKPGPATSVAEVLARALAMPDRDEIEQAAAERAAADARAEQRENEAMLNRMAGNPRAEVTRYQAAVSECRDQVTDLESRLEAARGRLSRASENLAHWSQAADEVTATARRSAPADLLGPAKAVLAGHQQYVAAGRAAWQSAQAGAPRQRRPFGGVARRSEPPVECPECVKAGCTWEESVLIHHDSDLARNPDPDHAERRRVHGAYAEIRR